MKTKPVSHKLDNTFKFESFGDRLSQINVSVLHNLRQRVNDVSADEAITLFAITYEKWFDLNSSRHFIQLRKSIGNVVSVQTLPQIVNRKDELIDTLLTNLSVKDNLAANVALELLVALSRDLTTDFYQYFEKVLLCLTDLLDTTDPQLIEQIVVCFTFLFKYLWKYIIKDFAVNYKLFATLLMRKKEYIRQFTSESVSFLVRKSANKSLIIDIIFDSIVKEPKLIAGVAQLLFQSVKGVNNDFHSCAQTLIPLIYDIYFDSEDHNLDKTIALLTNQLTEYIGKQNSTIIWSTLLIDCNSKSSALKKTLPLLKSVIGFKRCQLVLNASKLVQHLLLYLDNNCLNDGDRNDILNSLNYLLFNCFKCLSTEDINLINTKLFESSCLTIEQIFDFSKSIANCMAFERILLPSILTFCGKHLVKQMYESKEFTLSLKFLTELILTKRQRPIYGINVNNVTKYVLNFDQDLCHIVLDLMAKTDDLKTIWSVFVCLPNFVPISDKSSICRAIVDIIFKLNTNRSTHSDNRWFGYSIVEAVTALIILKTDEPINELTPNFFIDLILNNQSNIELLQAFDLYLSFNKQLSEDILDLNLLEVIYKKSFEANLSSYNRIARYLTLHVLTLFDPPLPPTEDITVSKSSVFAICLESESIATNLHEYRSKVKCLQHLEYPLVKHLIPMSPSDGLDFDQMPVHYLLGVLYENLSLLWPPIQRLIESYAKGYKDKHLLFNILFTHLRQTTQQMNSMNEFQSNFYQKDVEYYLNAKQSLVKSSENERLIRPDFANHRLLILKTMQSLTEFIEPLNREFVPIFFDFLDNEMNSHLIFGQNSNEDISSETISDSQMDVDLNDNEEDVVTKKEPGISRRMLWKSFFSFLTVLSKFKNPKALYRQKELTNLYLNLLCSPDSELQKHAFNCIISYKYHFLDEFHDNFLRLIDEKTFKSEINGLILNSEYEKNVIQHESRSEIIPFLMRILYGKMMATSGTKRHGKNSADFRRSIILKVLTAFDQKELILFMDLIFAPIIEFVGHDYQSLNENIKAKLNVKQCIPLRQFQAMVKTLDFVLKHFGNHSQTITAYVLKVLIVISTFISQLFGESRHSINDHSIIRLKDIRSNCLKIAKTFFDTFDAYEYSSVEIDALFGCLVWPQLSHLDTQSLSNASPLLTFLISLSENSRYFKMFAKSDPLDNKLTPISAIIKVYANPKCQSKVIDAITQLFENLLVLDNFGDEDDDRKVPEILVNDIHTTLQYEQNNTTMNFGTFLLLPFTLEILNRIYNNFEDKKQTKEKSRKKKTKSLNQRFSSQELNILSQLSPYVSQSDESLKLIILLIKCFDGKKIDEQNELQTMKALSHLVNNISPLDVTHVLRLLIPLFGKVSNCFSRTQLCHTLQSLVKSDSQLSLLSKIITDMNAFNPKFPEEPDYPKRVNAFKQINEKLQTITRNEFNYELISILLYNCIHLIQLCGDMAIRESCLDILRNILLKFEELDDNYLFNVLIIKLLLNSIITKGLRNKSETIRHNMIEILQSLMDISVNRHPILKQLALLCDKEDEEIDFWLNIKHIQIHRRGRALNRLVRNEQLLQNMSNKIFSDFLIPLTANFLTESYSKQTSLVNASVEAMGAFSKHIHWNKYYYLLKNYVNQLIQQKGDQKVNIKIISAILDNFNFNNTVVTQPEDQTKADMDVDVIKSQEPANDKILDLALNNLLPLLHKCLHQKSQIDYAFDSMKTEYSEDDEIQRAPIALAIIKLLKSLNCSQQVLKTNISSVFLRLCQFLKSKTQSIRDSARNTFIKVMDCLGAKYLADALKEMRSSLSKGYQRHVFVYTVCQVLSSLRSQLKSGDLDNCLDCLLEVCSLELFGSLAEEKDVSQITTKLKEAKKFKSFEIFQLLATFVSEDCLVKLLAPLKTTLLSAQNHKVVRKVSQSLSKVGQGLVSNTGLNDHMLLKFTYDIINETLNEKQLKLNGNVNDKKIRPQDMRVDSFIIEKPIYQRSEKVSKLGESANSHVIIEFGLNFYLALIKQKRIQSSNEENLALLDPFIALLNTILNSKDANLTTLSLHCLYLMYTKFSVLPSFSIHSENIMQTIFVLLNKYAKFGISDKDDDNVQLVLLCFKSLSLFIKDRTDVTINNEQMAVLLSYVDQDLHNDSHQSTVFIILKSIIHRKYNSPDFHRIMKNVAQMAITSQNDSIRNTCGDLSVKYLIGYSQANNMLTKRINFFIRHLEYEKTTGRESALDVMSHLVCELNYDYLRKNIAVFFVPLSSRLVNETESRAKKSVADSLTKLLKRMTQSDRNDLFNDMVIPWLKSEPLLQTLLASHLCSLFLSVENKDFMNRLPQVLPLITQQLDPTRYEKCLDVAKSADNLVYQHLNLFIKLLKVDPQLIKKNKFIDDVNAILDHILTNHLLHQHLWVRVISSQIFGQLFAQYSTQCLANSVDNSLESYEFLLSQTNDKLRQLATKCCLLFRDIYNADVLTDQLIKNLVFISRVFIQTTVDNTDDNSFKWITNKLIFEVKYELKNSPQLNAKRICVIKWMAAVAVELTADRLGHYLPNFLPLLCREESNADNSSENEVLVLTKQVLQLFKNIIGTEKFSDYYTKAKTELTLKKLDRKKTRAIQSVNEVMKSAKRKIDKHNKNKVSKKRKTSNFKNKK